MKRVFTFSLLLIHLLGFSQTNLFDKADLDAKVLFLGEAHRIEENYTVKMNLLRTAVEKYGYNTLVLELATSNQIIVDRILQTGDTTGIHYLYPVVIGKSDTSEYNYTSTHTFFLELSDFMKQHQNIKVTCIDIEFGLKKVQKLLLDFIDTTYISHKNTSNYFLELKNASSIDEIKEELLNLYDTQKKWRKYFSKSNASYLCSVVNHIHLDKISTHQWFHREKYLYTIFNDEILSDKNSKTLAFFGAFHAQKSVSDSIQTWENVPTVAYYLQNNKKSNAKQQVKTMAMTYFFKTTADTTLNEIGIFTKQDVQTIKNEMAEEKYALFKSNQLGLTNYVQKSYDYIIGINDCHKMFKDKIYY